MTNTISAAQKVETATVSIWFLKYCIKVVIIEGGGTVILIKMNANKCNGIRLND